MKVLVVDDELEICNLLSKFLTEKGDQVVTAADGEEALAKVERERPQMVLLDIDMPGMNGMEVLRRIKEMDDGIGVIMTSMARGMDTVEQALRMGVNDYLTKPIDFDYLDKVLISWKQLFLKQ
ncbi:MAG: response regulator [Candidatus Latescibacterota bacterium]